MAKKKPSYEPTLAEKIEEAMRLAISTVPECTTVSELEYVEAVIEACSAIKLGNEMRRDELDPEDAE